LTCVVVLKTLWHYRASVWLNLCTFLSYAAYTEVRSQTEVIMTIT